MSDWALSSNHYIDSFLVGDYISYLVVRVRSVERLKTVERSNFTKYDKLSFIVDNAKSEQDGSEKIIQCIVHDGAARKYAASIKENTIICIREARVQERKDSPGNTPFSLRIFSNSEITQLADSRYYAEMNQKRSSSRPGTSLEKEFGQPLESSINRTKRKRTDDFLAEFREGLLQLDESKRRKFELDTLCRLQTAMNDD